MANVRRVAIPLNVHSPLAAPGGQDDDTISKPPLQTKIGIPQGRIVHIEEVMRQYTESSWIYRYLHKFIMHRKGTHATIGLCI